MDSDYDAGAEGGIPEVSTGSRFLKTDIAYILLILFITSMCHTLFYFVQFKYMSMNLGEFYLMLMGGGFLLILPVFIARVGMVSLLARATGFSGSKSLLFKRYAASYLFYMPLILFVLTPMLGSLGVLFFIFIILFSSMMVYFSFIVSVKKTFLTGMRQDLDFSYAIIITLASEMIIIAVLTMSIYLFNTMDLFVLFYPGIGDLSAVFNENFLYYFKQGFIW